MADDVDNSRVVGRKRHVRTAGDFRKGFRVTALQRDLHRCRTSTAWTPEDHSPSIRVPPEKMAHQPDISQLAGVATVRIHYPNFRPAALIGVVSNQLPVRRKKRIHIDGFAAGQSLRFCRINVEIPNIRRTRTGREEGEALAVRRPVWLKVTTGT